MRNSLICERIPGDGNSLITIHDTASAEKKLHGFQWEVHLRIISGIIKYNFIKAVAV